MPQPQLPTAGYLPPIKNPPGVTALAPWADVLLLKSNKLGLTPCTGVDDDEEDDTASDGCIPVEGNKWFTIIK